MEWIESQEGFLINLSSIHYFGSTNGVDLVAYYGEMDSEGDYSYHILWEGGEEGDGCDLLDALKKRLKESNLLFER